MVDATSGITDPSLNPIVSLTQAMVATLLLGMSDTVEGEPVTTTSQVTITINGERSTLKMSLTMESVDEVVQ